MGSVYLDWAATSPLRPEAAASLLKSHNIFHANASSPYLPGRESAEILETCRSKCSSILDTKKESLIFTSGGTESNSIVFSSLFRKRSRGRVIVSGIEHPSVFEFISSLGEAGFDTVILKTDKRGFVSVEDLSQNLDSSTLLVAVMHVNNETGAVQPVGELVKTVREFEKKTGRPIHFHTDSVQSLCKIPSDLHAMDVDSASYSAHKIGGPKGVGLLYLKKRLNTLSSGGGQELGIRPGTENIAGIEAFTAALTAAAANFESESDKALSIRDALISGLSGIKGIKLLFPESTDDMARFSPYILNLSAAPVPGEILVRVLGDKGIYLSTGSACSSKKVRKRTRVLVNSGIIDSDARSSLRISTGWSTGMEDISLFLQHLEDSIKDLGMHINH